MAAASSAHPAAPAAAPATAIKHVVVIFDENISFDHYFGTYPSAPNPKGEPAFHDSVLGPLVTQSATSLDALTETGQCGSSPNLVQMNTAHQPEQGRCGVGPRLPFLLISPSAKKNFVDSSFADQSSVDRLIEFNWHLPGLGNAAADAAAGSIVPMFTFGRTPGNGTLFINPSTGEPMSKP